jgi:hypothetical protein
MRQRRIDFFSHLVGQLDHGFPPDSRALSSLAITYNAWGLTVNLYVDAAVVTHPTAASRIEILHGLCKPWPWLQA